MMQTHVHIYRPGNSQPEIKHVEIADGYNALAVFITPLLDGASLEHVSVLFSNKRRDMFVDETGQVKGLPVNEAATEIYWNASRRRGRLDEATAPRIHGVAVLFPDRQVWF